MHQPSCLSLRSNVLLLMLPMVLMSVATALSAVEIPFGASITIDESFRDPFDAEAVDLDGDGDVDLVLSSELGGVAWQENGGNASTWTHHDIDTGLMRPLGVATGDIDGDGDLDVIGADGDGDTFYWWENDLASGAACGSDFCAHSIGTGDNATHVAVADLDGDGDLDVIGTARDDDEVLWFENTAGDGSAWTERLVAGGLVNANAVASGDIDADGDIDVLVGADSGNSGLAWYQNDLDGNGTCGGSDWCRQSFAVANSTGVQIADMDGDGDLDLVRAYDDVSWWENTSGDGSLWSEHDVGTTASTVTAIDLDLDGDLDLVPGSDTTIWIENTVGDGSSWTERSVSDDEASLQVGADLDGDGDRDLVSLSSTLDRIDWRQNQTLHRSASYPVTRTVATGFSTGSGRLSAADMDQDGDQDLVVTNADNDLQWMENLAGDGSLWTAHTISSALFFLDPIPADVDSDGDIDVAVAVISGISGSIRLLRNDGGSWSLHTVVTGLRRLHGVDDLDGDGDLDVLARSEFTSTTAWVENAAGDGSSWIERGLESFRPLVPSADVDRDGDLDLVGKDPGTQELIWWENAVGDASTWTRRLLIADATSTSNIAWGDIDGDGDGDLAVTRSDEATVWLENTTGDGSTWVEHTIGEFSSPMSVLLGDADLDGDADVIMRSGGTPNDGLVWWENTGGDGSLWTPNTITEGEIVTGLQAWVDLDGDGDLDAVTRIPAPASLVWFRNETGQVGLEPSPELVSNLPNEGSTDVLLFDAQAAHLGRSGDASAELIGLSISFQDGLGDLIDLPRLNALVSSIAMRRDDGDGVFEPAEDVAISVVNAPFTGSALQELAPVQGDENAEIAVGAPASLWISMDLTADAGTQEMDSFVVRIDPSQADFEMAGTGLPLDLQYADPMMVEITEVNTLPLLVLPLTDQIATEGMEHVVELGVSFEDPDGQILTFSAVGLPSSFRVSGDSIVGTPSSLDLADSPYTVTVQATDPAGAAVEDTFLLTLTPDLDAIFVDGFESGDTSGWTSASP